MGSCRLADKVRLFPQLLEIRKLENKQHFPQPTTHFVTNGQAIWLILLVNK